MNRVSRTSKHKRNKKKTIWIIVIVVLIVLVAVGAYVIFQKRGAKAVENLPVAYHADALANANSDVPFPDAQTDPANFGFVTNLFQSEGPGDAPFKRQEPIDFASGDDYTQLPGLVTFRGNNYRNTASYGSPVITEKKFDKSYWTVATGSMAKSDDTKGKGSDEWSGSGWTGQPIIVQWDNETRQVMNLYPDKKAKDGLVEIIYATMDGHVYFLDMEDGSATRDPLNIGFPFKGAGAIDPRGIPMLFVGAGDSVSQDVEGSARAFIYSLTDFTKLYEFGANDPFSPRMFHAYDSSALVDAETDTLLYPGENAVLYTMKLNTQFDKATGALSINPTNLVNWTYSTNRTSEEDYWWGMEDSASVWGGYMFMTDNAGYMMCLDLNTMQLVWAQDILDDTNSSPVFEQDTDGNKFLYTAPSLHWEQNDKAMGQISIYKINAMTGGIVWQKPYEVHTVNGVSGGVQATPVLGQNSIADLILYPVARTPYKQNGVLVALDKNTGEERWTFNMEHYAWSSPVAVYAADGTAYIIQCDSKGNMFLLDGVTGALLDTINMGANIEASPAVYGNTVVVGTRGKQIVGVTLK